MAYFEVNVENAAGTVQGSGPLRGVTSLSESQELDSVGKVTLDLPATDSRAALFPANTLRYIRAHAVRAGMRVQIAHGLIKQRGTNSESGGLQLSGHNIAGELNHYHVGKLIIGTATGDDEYDPLPAVDVFPLVEPFAPGWTITGAPSAPVYWRGGDETVAEAITKICAIHGDHWRIDPTTERQIEILPTTSSGFVPTASGVRAIDQGEGHALDDNDAVCLIVGGLQEVADAYERATRLLLRGGGNGDAQLYINKSTRFSAPGDTPGDYTDGDYTMHIDADPDLSYIAYDPAETDGYIEDIETLRDIAPIGSKASDEVNAANALVDAGKVRLRQRQQEQRSYRFRVTKVRQPLYPGDSIRVVCRHYTDSYGWMLVDEDMLLLKVTPKYTAEGGDPDYDLQVTQIAVDRWPVSAAQKIADGIANIATVASHKQKAAAALTADVALSSTTSTGGTDTFVVESTTGQTILGLSANPGNNRSIAWYSIVTGSRVLRWLLRANSTAESGSNAGSDLELLARTDAGGAIATVMTFKRSTGYIGLQGVSSPTSFLHHGGSVAYALATLTGATTLSAAHHIIRADASGGAFTVSLPEASTRLGREYRIVRINSAGGNVTVGRSGSDLINGATTYALTAQWQSVTVVATASGEWSVF